MKNNLKFYSFVLLIMLIGCKANDTSTEFKIDETILVSVIPIEKGVGSSQTEASGLFSTDDETLLSFKNGGIINHIYVNEGDKVKKGQLLAALDMTELNAKERQLKAAMNKAERDYNRAEKLYKDSVATLEQFQNAQTALEVVKQDYNTIEFNLKHSQIRANVDGYILLKLANEGQVVGPGMPIFQINGAGQANWIVKVGVSDFQWANLKEGDSALISTDALPKPIPAKIIRKSEGLDPNSGTFTVSVRPINSKGLKVASGMFARVTIYGQSADAWYVSYNALLDGNKGTGAVFVTNDKKTVKRVPVKIGSIQKDNVMITSGLEDYKYLIVSGSPYLKEGSKIKVVE